MSAEIYVLLLTFCLFFMWNITEEWNQWCSGKKCGVLTVDRWLPKEATWKFRIFKCCWGAFSEIDNAGICCVWQTLLFWLLPVLLFILDVWQTLSFWLFPIFCLYFLLSTGICIETWKRYVSKCWKESLWWSSQLVRESSSSAGLCCGWFGLHFVVAFKLDFTLIIVINLKPNQTKPTSLNPK